MVAAWAGLVAVAVAASSLYLSLWVRTALASRTLAALERELEQERRRGEQLEVALARSVGPAATERAARELLAMERPRQVEMVLVDVPPPSEQGRWLARQVGRSGGPVAAQASGSPSRWERAWDALAQLWGSSMALARRLPQWP